MSFKKFCVILLLLWVSLGLATNVHFPGTFNRDDCYYRSQVQLNATNGTLEANDDVFFRDSNGYPMSSVDNMTYTLPGCRQMCGGRFGFYVDIGPRYSTWLIPSLLLLSNIELTPLDKNRFMAILHMIGDPIDSLLSLLHKIDSWRHCYSLATKLENGCRRRTMVIATVLAGFEEMEGFLMLLTDSSSAQITLQRELGSLTSEAHFNEWRRAAADLADSRSNQFLRTVFAVVLYLFQVIAGFVKQVGGGNSSPPAGRIGTAMFVSWLVLAVLLSNTIGTFPSRRTCYDILNRFSEEISKLPGAATGHTFQEDYFDSLRWAGGIDTFRPWKLTDIRRHRTIRQASFLVVFGCLPVWIATGGAFVIIWYNLPVGINCRHIWVLGIFAVWHISPVLTWSLSPRSASTDPSVKSWRPTFSSRQWRLVLIKDAIIGCTTLLIIFLSAAGVFNSCFCWSGWYYLHGQAHVPMNSTPYFDEKDDKLYPYLVMATLVCQLGLFGIVWWGWRRGIRLMRWTQLEIEDEWGRVRNKRSKTSMACCICRRRDAQRRSYLRPWIKVSTCDSQYRADTRNHDHCDCFVEKTTVGATIAATPHFHLDSNEETTEKSHPPPRIEAGIEPLPPHDSSYTTIPIPQSVDSPQNV